jgi:TRAP-type mannitol/chloroaromatic compound transport system substrate-binding protein
MREKQVFAGRRGAHGALVAVIALWTLDRVAGQARHRRVRMGPVEVIEWKLVTTWPKGLPGLGAAPENFARRVNEASGGRLRIKVFGAGEIVPAFEVFDAVPEVWRRPATVRPTTGRARSLRQCFIRRCPLA